MSNNLYEMCLMHDLIFVYQIDMTQRKERHNNTRIGYKTQRIFSFGKKITY